MDENQIVDINPYRWSNTNHGEYMEMAETHIGAANLTNPKLLSAFGAFKAARKVEDENYILVRGSSLTAEIKAADEKQDAGVAGLRGMANAFARHSDATKSGAAQKVKAIFRRYKVNIGEQVAREAYKVENLLQELDTDEMKAAVAAIEGTQFVEMMREGSTEVHRLLTDRNTEQSTRVAQAMKKARLATDEAYKTLIALINAAALLSETGEYDALVRQINQDIAYVEEKMLPKSGKSGGSKKDDADDSGDNSDSGNDNAGGSGDGGGNGSGDGDNSGDGGGSGDGDGDNSGSGSGSGDGGGDNSGSGSGSGDGGGGGSSDGGGGNVLG